MYHPFQTSSFGFSLQNYTAGDNESWNFLDNIDLYHQPIPSLEISMTVFFIRSSLAIIGEYVNVKLYLKLKDETGILTDILKLNTITQMVMIPLHLLLYTTTDFIHPVNEIIGEWFCIIGWFVLLWGWQIVHFHSFIVGLMRFMFIVKSEKVQKTGRENMKNAFYYISIFIPLVIVLWGLVHFTKEVRASPNVSRCYGVDHRIFLADTSSLSILTEDYTDLVTDINIDGPLEIVRSILNKLSNLLHRTILVLNGLSLSEGFLNYMTLSYMNRYVFIKR